MFDTDDIIYRSASKGAPQSLDALYHFAIPIATNSSFRTHHCTLYSSATQLHSYAVYTPSIHQFMFIYETLPCLPTPYLCHLWPTTPAANNTHLSLLKDLITNSVFGESPLILTESSELLIISLMLVFTMFGSYNSVPFILAHSPRHTRDVAFGQTTFVNKDLFVWLHFFKDFYFCEPFWIVCFALHLMQPLLSAINLTKNISWTALSLLSP